MCHSTLHRECIETWGCGTIKEFKGNLTKWQADVSTGFPHRWITKVYPKIPSEVVYWSQILRSYHEHLHLLMVRDVICFRDIAEHKADASMINPLEDFSMLHVESERTLLIPMKRQPIRQCDNAFQKETFHPMIKYLLVDHGPEEVCLVFICENEIILTYKGLDSNTPCLE
jgi:hypothetical protein